MLNSYFPFLCCLFEAIHHLINLQCIRPLIATLFAEELSKKLFVAILHIHDSVQKIIPTKMFICNCQFAILIGDIELMT